MTSTDPGVPNDAPASPALTFTLGELLERMIDTASRLLADESLIVSDPDTVGLVLLQLSEAIAVVGNDLLDKGMALVGHDLDADPSGGDVGLADTFEPLPGTPAAALLDAEREEGGR
jgi:hypothetical protein